MLGGLWQVAHAFVAAAHAEVRVVVGRIDLDSELELRAGLLDA